MGKEAAEMLVAWVGSTSSLSFWERSPVSCSFAGAMTIVEFVDAYGGFTIITDRISSTSKVKLLWIIGVLAFFLSAALDNLTTTIVAISLVRKLVPENSDRLFFAGIIVIAANAGGCLVAHRRRHNHHALDRWSITTMKIITGVFCPAWCVLLCLCSSWTYTLRGQTIESMTG